MKQSELRSLIREQVKTIIKEASNQNEYNEGDLVKFKDDKEVWQVVKAGMRNANDKVQSNEVTIKPYDALAKRNNVSVPIDITIEYLNANTEKINESVLKETFIGPFVFTSNTPEKELQAMYHGALDGYANYKTGMKFSKADYKLAYQTIERLLKKKGVAITEAVYHASDDAFIEEWISMELGDEGDAVIDKTIEYVKEEWKEAAVNYPNVRAYLMDLRKNGGLEGLGESINEDAGMVIDVAMGVAVGLMGLWALVQSAPLVGRVFGDAAEYLATKSEKKAKLALKDKRKETIAPIIAKFKNDKQLADMYQNLTPYSAAAKLGSSQAGLKAQQGRVNQLTKIGNYIKSKLTPDELVYFRDISAMLRDGDIK